MKRIIIATSLAALVGLTACTENYQSSIDFGDNTYINDYSELAKAINDLSKSLNERLSALNQLLEEHLVAIKISINAQTHAIQTQSTAIEQGLGQINTSLLNGFAATQSAINAQGEKIVTQNNVTMLTVKRVYETSEFNVTIWEYCSHPHIHTIMIIDAEHTDYHHYRDTSSGSNVTTPVSVTFKNYYNGTYCANPLAKVYCNY